MVTKRSHILKQTCSFELQVCLNMCDLYVTTRHERVNNLIHKTIAIFVVSIKNLQNFICLVLFSIKHKKKENNIQKYLSEKCLEKIKQRLTKRFPIKKYYKLIIFFINLFSCLTFANHCIYLISNFINVCASKLYHKKKDFS